MWKEGQRRLLGAGRWSGGQRRAVGPWLGPAEIVGVSSFRRVLIVMRLPSGEGLLSPEVTRWGKLLVLMYNPVTV